MDCEKGFEMKRHWMMGMMCVVVTLATSSCRPPEGIGDGRIELTYQTIETLPEQQALHREIVTAFEREHPDIKIKVVYDTSRFQKLNVQLAGKAAPDVFYYVVDRLPSLAKRGAVRELDDLFAPLRADFFPQVVEPCRIDGKLAMMPFHFSTDVVFVNADWFAEAAPDWTKDWTWEDFAVIAQRMATARKVKYGTILPRPLLLLQSYGVALFAGDKPTMNTPEAEAALALYRRMVAENIAPSRAAMEETEAFDGVNLFRAEKIGMLVGRTYMLTEFDKITGFKWDTRPVPSGLVPWSRLSVGGNCIWSGTAHPDAAWKFARFYSLEGARLSASRRNAVPAFKEAAQLAKFPATMMQALDYSHLDNPWAYTFWDEFNHKAFTQTTDAVALGQITPAEALRNIEALATRLLADN